MSDRPDALQVLRDLVAGTYVELPRPEFDATDGALFAAVAGATLEPPAADLATGLEVRTTYAHMFAPAMVAFRPPPRSGAPHPAPWHAVDGPGVATTAVVELSLAAGARPFRMPRLETIRFAGSMMRLLSASSVQVTLLSDTSFGEIAGSKRRPWIWAIEPVPILSGPTVELTPGFLGSLASIMPAAEEIMVEEDVFRAFSLVDFVWWLPSTGAQMTVLWTAAETLMRPGRTDVGKGLARAISAYIGQDQSEGDRLFNEVSRLYDARGMAAHAGDVPALADVRASYMIVRTILLRAILDRVRPPRPAEIVRLWHR